MDDEPAIRTCNFVSLMTYPREELAAPADMMVAVQVASEVLDSHAGAGSFSSFFRKSSTPIPDVLSEQAIGRCSRWQQKSAKQSCYFCFGLQTSQCRRLTNALGTIWARQFARPSLGDWNERRCLGGGRGIRTPE